MFIVDDFISYWIHRFFDYIFGKKDKESEELIKLLAERDSQLKGLENEKKSFEKKYNSVNKDKSKILNSLKQRKISPKRIIEKYNNPLKAILISYATQKEEKKKGQYVESHFVKEELKRYNSRYLGGTDAIIPPAKVPKWIKTKQDLEKWFEKDILKGRYCKVKFIALVDLKSEVYWGKYIPYEQKKPKHFNIDEVFSIEDLLTEEQIKTISIIDIIRDGDIVWLLSPFLSSKEIEIILTNQSLIEDTLNSPSLRFYSNKKNVAKVNKVLKRYIDNKDLGELIHKEASFWFDKIKS